MTASGQDEGRPPREGRGREGFRDRGERGGRDFGRRGGLDTERLSRELASQLLLTLEQKEQVDGLIAAYDEQAQSARERLRGNRDQMADLMRQMREARDQGDTDRMAALRDQFRALQGDRGGPGFGGERGAEFRELLEQMRDARQSGDQAKMQELRDKLQALRGAAGPQNPAEKLLADLRATLTPEQHGTYDEIVQRLTRRGGGPASLDQIMPPQRFAEAAAAAQLAPEKIQAIELLVQEFVDALRDTDPTERRDLFAQYREEVEKLSQEIALTDDEKQRILAAAGDGRGRRGRGRGEDGGERFRGRRGARQIEAP